MVGTSVTRKGQRPRKDVKLATRKREKKRRQSADNRNDDISSASVAVCRIQPSCMYDSHYHKCGSFGAARRIAERERSGARSRGAKYYKCPTKRATDCNLAKESGHAHMHGTTKITNILVRASNDPLPPHVDYKTTTAEAWAGQLDPAGQEAEEKYDAGSDGTRRQVEVDDFLSEWSDFCHEAEGRENGPPPQPPSPTPPGPPTPAPRVQIRIHPAREESSEDETTDPEDEQDDEDVESEADTYPVQPETASATSALSSEQSQEQPSTVSETQTSTAYPDFDHEFEEVSIYGNFATWYGSRALHPDDVSGSHVVHDYRQAKKVRGVLGRIKAKARLLQPPKVPHSRTHHWITKNFWKKHASNSPINGHFGSVRRGTICQGLLRDLRKQPFHFSKKLALSAGRACLSTTFKSRALGYFATAPPRKRDQRTDGLHRGAYWASTERLSQIRRNTFAYYLQTAFQNARLEQQETIAGAGVETVPDFRQDGAVQA